MPDNPNTDSPTEHPAPDTEDWETAFEPYKGHPGAALMLGFNFIILKSYLAVTPLKIREANDGIDCALEVLFPHTQFHELSYELFLKVVEGRLTFEEDQLLRSLGLNF